MTSTRDVAVGFSDHVGGPYVSCHECVRKLNDPIRDTSKAVSSHHYQLLRHGQALIPIHMKSPSPSEAGCMPVHV